MGTMLQGFDLSLDDFQGLEGCNEVLNVTRPDVVTAIHAEYLAAGADCIETNTFGANLAALGEYDIPDRIAELAGAGARLARAAAAEMHSGFAALRTQLPMNSRRRPDGYRWDAAAQRDIDRVQALWRTLRREHGAGGDFLFGGFGIVDAMFAPVAIRFDGYGVALDDTAAAYLQALSALPALQQWRQAAAQESARVAATDALCRPG